MKELGITKGEWNVNGEYYRNKVMVNNSTIHVYHTVVTFGGVMVTYNNAKANALLIADAGNTAQKCGLLPSELLQQRDELREALKWIKENITGWCFLGKADAMLKIEAAIKNTER